ncbi:hypothetical protein F0562_015843 [Nyssa sinensis]|uniref:Uncharacterized protein n=1 Tax=Nyssa sinensis TaxID=561372 RepID=A0A5J4ZKD0_9ASTE|nr:hypothetical protein F0562_015843 [Nyssa sinensis]
MDTARVQHVTKSSSDQLLSKFAEVGSESGEKAAAKKERQLSKRRKRSRTTREGDHCESPSNCSTTIVERKSLLPPATRRSVALIRKLGIGRAKLRARDLKNKSFLGTIEKTWRKTIEGASKVFMEKHYNRHKRLINDIA